MTLQVGLLLATLRYADLRFGLSSCRFLGALPPPFVGPASSDDAKHVALARSHHLARHCVGLAQKAYTDLRTEAAKAFLVETRAGKQDANDKKSANPALRHVRKLLARRSEPDDPAKRGLSTEEARLGLSCSFFGPRQTRRKP